MPQLHWLLSPTWAPLRCSLPARWLSGYHRVCSCTRICTTWSSLQQTCALFSRATSGTFSVRKFILLVCSQLIAVTDTTRELTSTFADRCSDRHAYWGSRRLPVGRQLAGRFYARWFLLQWSERICWWLMATLSVEHVFVILLIYFPLRHRVLHSPNVTIALLCALLLYAFVAARAERLCGDRCTPISCTNVGRSCHMMPIDMSWFEIFLLVIYSGFNIYALSCPFQFAILVACCA